MYANAYNFADCKISISKVCIWRALPYNVFKFCPLTSALLNNHSTFKPEIREARE